MQIYRVGGYVRDTLLGIQPKDTDYVVVNSSTKEMEALNYKQVGDSFPVFLHPETGEEYALARIERKTSAGYNGFEVKTENVTLYDDLKRRDLTINSMAMKDDGTIMDPFNGHQDLIDKKLRHTSEAFKEDPIRVLRLARFKAQFGPLWSIHSTTKVLINSMHSELRSLQPERVWKEVEKALNCPYPDQFFKSLLEMNVLHIVFPSIWSMVICMENSKWHQESSVFEHTMRMLSMATEGSLRLKLATLYHDIAKPPLRYENGHGGGHEDISYINANNLITLRMPAKLRSDIELLVQNHIRLAMIPELTTKKILKLFLQYKDESLLQDQMTLMKYDNTSADSLMPRQQLNEQSLLSLRDRLFTYKVNLELLKDKPGHHIKQIIHKDKLAIVAQWRKEYDI